MSIIETMLKKLFGIKYVILIMLSSFCKTVFYCFPFFNCTQVQLLQKSTKCNKSLKVNNEQTTATETSIIQRKITITPFVRI